MNTTYQLPEPELGYIKTDKSNQPAFSARQMREVMGHAAQPAEVSDAELLDTYNSIDPCNESPQDRLIRRLRAILALRPVQSTFCEYCGGNDEEPVDHCMDCTRPVQVPMNQDEAIAAIKSANISSSTTFWSIFEAGIRAAEAHHGIIAKTEGEK